MSNSVRPHRQQPTRLPSPWDSPGKNTGVGCHFLLQHMKVKSESKVAQLCPTLQDPMDCSLPGSLVHGIFHARVLEWVAISFSFFSHKGHLIIKLFILPKVYFYFEFEKHCCWSPAPAARDSTWRGEWCWWETEAASQFSWTACLFQAYDSLLYFYKSIRSEVWYFQFPLTQICCLHKSLLPLKMSFCLSDSLIYFFSCVLVNTL